MASTTSWEYYVEMIAIIIMAGNNDNKATTILIGNSDAER